MINHWNIPYAILCVEILELITPANLDHKKISPGLAGGLSLSVRHTLREEIRGMIHHHSLCQISDF